MDDSQVELITTQLSRLSEQLCSRIQSLEHKVDHLNALEKEKWENLRGLLDDLRKTGADHEARIRTLQDGVTGLKTWSSLTGGGSSIVSLIALVRAFLQGG